MGDDVPTPSNILRGHRAQIHAAAFIRNNERLATGDADGYVTLWDLTIMRPRAVWRAHESALLTVKGWGKDRVITHGRDHKLIVWKLGEEDEERMSTVLPVEGVAAPRPEPWVLHLLHVNTMNFCPFGSCEARELQVEGMDETTELLIAVPNSLQSESIDIYALPSQARICVLDPGKGNGMAMSLSLVSREGSLTLLAAFENGYASVHCLEQNKQWTMTYRSQVHTQPILSLAVAPNNEYFLTSSADAVIAKHPIPSTQQESEPAFDPNNRVIEEVEAEDDAPSLLSAEFKKASAQSKTSTSKTSQPKIELKPWDAPIKTVNTKHAGQQGIKIRSDGRIFATAGWDSNVRVYSCKTLKELAVLQWHKVGCYAVAFADIEDAEPRPPPPKTKESPFVGGETAGQATGEDQLAKQGTAPVAGSIVSVKDRRVAKAKAAHWIAAGAKDGKVSLWTIY